MVRDQARIDVAYITRVAVKKGFIVEPGSCEKCGKEGVRLEKHHRDYTKPLDVTWCCVPCHRKIHGTRKKATYVTGDSYLRDVRQGKGLTLRSASHLIGISRQGLKLIEDNTSKRPRMATVEKIARVYGLNVQEVIALFPEKQEWINRRVGTKKTAYMKTKTMRIKLIEAGKKQVWLAVELGIPATYLSSYLRGAPLTVDLSNKIIEMGVFGGWDECFYMRQD